MGCFFVTEQATDTASAVWLTQADYERLQAELEELSGPGRTEIVDKIETARAEGDLKENGGYHAAKDEQGKLEARIRQLTQLLRNAQVGEAPDTGGKAAAGMVVTIQFDGDDNNEKFLLGSREGSGGGLEQVYSPQSPLGQAVTGHSAGDTVSYQTPTGATINVELISVERYVG
jgi:transcription elongation factor GreA